MKLFQSLSDSKSATKEWRKESNEKGHEETLDQIISSMEDICKSNDNVHSINKLDEIIEPILYPSGTLPTATSTFLQQSPSFDAYKWDNNVSIYMSVESNSKKWRQLKSIYATEVVALIKNTS